MIPDDLSTSNLLTAIIGARLVYFDGRLHETALLVAQEVIFECLFCFHLGTNFLLYILFGSHFRGTMLIKYQD